MSKPTALLTKDALDPSGKLTLGQLVRLQLFLYLSLLFTVSVIGASTLYLIFSLFGDCGFANYLPSLT